MKSETNGVSSINNGSLKGEVNQGYNSTDDVIVTIAQTVVENHKLD